jgi:hypothetical protein
MIDLPPEELADDVRQGWGRVLGCDDGLTYPHVLQRRA